MKTYRVFVLLLVLILFAACEPATAFPTLPSPTLTPTRLPTTILTLSYDPKPCPVAEFAWSADKSILALACQGGGIYFYDPVAWKETKFIRTGGRFETDTVQSLAFSPDGKILLYTLWSQLWKYDITSGKQTTLTVEKYLWRLGSHGNRILFAPDGQNFALRSVSHPENGVIVPTYGVSIWSSAGEERFNLISNLPNAEAIWNIVYSPDGKLLAAASLDNRIWLWNAASGQLLQKLEGHFSDVHDVTFPPSLEILASASSDGTVRFWDLSSRETIQVLKGFKTEVHHVLFSPDGKLLVIGLANGELQVWHLDEQGLPIEPVALKWQVQAEAHSSYFYQPPIIERISFGSGSSQLTGLSGGGDLLLWDVTTGTSQRSIIQPTMTPYASATPDPTQVQEWTATSTFLPTLSPTPGPIREATAIVPPTLPANAISPATLDRLARQNELQSGYLLASAWSPDGSTLALAGTKGIWLYDMGDGSLQKFISSEASVVNVTFSRNGRFLAYFLEDSRIVVLDRSTGKHIHTLPGKAVPGRLEFGQDDRTLTARYSRSIGEEQVWDLETGRLLEPTKEAGYAVAASPDDRYHAYVVPSGNGESTAIKIVDRLTGEIVQVLEQSGGASHSAELLFSPDGTHFALWTQSVRYIRTVALTGIQATDNSIQLWQIDPDQSFTLIRTMETGDLPSGDWKIYWHIDQILSFSPDGKWLAAIHHDKDLELWDASSGRLLERLPVRGNVIDFSPDGSRLLVLRNHGEAEVWSITPGKSARRQWRLDGFGGQAEIASSGHLLAATSWHDLKWWDIQTGNPTARILKTDHALNIMTLSPDGRFLASNGQAGEILIWSTRSGSRTLRLSGHPISRWTGERSGYIRALVYSPDGRFLASAGEDGMVRLWEAHNGRRLAEFISLDASNLVFSPGGDLLAVAGGEMMDCSAEGCIPAHTEIEIWNVSDHSLLRTFALAGQNIAFHPDGIALVSVSLSSGLVQVFDVNTGVIRNTWQGPAKCTEVFFTADGRYLVTVHDRSLEFWEPATGRLVAARDFPYPILHARLSPDETILFLAYANGIIESWRFAPE